LEMTGEQLIPASQQAVWQALNDPEVLKACIPGCETIDRTSDTDFTLAMMAAVGPIRARFRGKLAIGEIDAPHRYVLSFEGSGGPAGFGKGSASVTLAPQDSATRLAYTAKAQVGGKLAQVGSRLIDGVAKKMADDFFGRFTARFTHAAAPGEAQAASRVDVDATANDAARAASDRSAATPVAGSAGHRKWAIAVAVAVALVALAYTIAR